MKPDSASTHRAATAGNGDVVTTDDRGSQLLAAVAALLQRYTDRSELTLGYAARPESPPRPIRLDLSDNPRFDDLVGQILLASANGEQAVDPAAALDAVVALDQDPPAGEGHALWVTEHQTPDGAELRVRDSAGDTGLGTTNRLLGHLRTMLDSAADDGEQTIAELAILTDNERQQLLLEWNATESPYPDRCLHELIAAQAQRTPDAVAVRCAGHDLTYRELDLRANRLAHHLVGLGVRPEVLVGICVERSLEMVVGLLGILKAGGAYVPVDPAYPTDRQTFMLTNSEAPVIVTQERLLDGLPLEGLNVVCLDRDWPAIDALPAEAPEVQSDPEQLAYVIYTSGSTGQPKGVQIPHRALVNFLETMRQTPGLAGDDVLVAVTTLSFDIAGLELYLPLIVGARVVVATADTVTDPRGLAQLLETNSATVMQATPTTWRMLLDSGWTGTPELKVLCGGEALPVALADRLVAAGLELWNMYGPTETTIWSTCANVRTQGEGLTIGRPIANTFLYILDGGLAPVPVGVDGELWIGGDGLARGYRGRPDLTEERFVPNPFVAEDDARMYHTGDLARYRPDGTVEFLGRIDHQVKVRGFRIELGEIETVLARHPGIAEAVVIARGDTTAEAELAAYVIPHADAVASRELREYAGESLPAYMVPSTVTTLDGFPLTPNGKVDRKALPEPTRERSGERELVAPTTPLEIRLTEIWERELGISPIGVTDDFFDLGVTSIVAATLFAAIEHELGGELPLGAIFQAPTIRALAELLEGSAGTSRWTSLIPIQPHGSKPPIFCIHGGAGTILHLAALSRRLGPDQPFYGLQSRGLYGGATPLTTVEEMATHYLSEMRQVWPSGPWYIAGYCFGTIVAFELAQRLTAHGEDVRLLAMFNGPSPTWIKRWGWHGNQPSWLAKHPLAPQATTQQRRRGKLAAIKPRLRRALREPKRFWTALGWYLWEPRTRLALALGRPIPEQLRETYFLQLHAKAEKAYDPPVYPGEVILFYGEGLYEDPTLGWGAFAAGELRSYGVPGEHDSNRQAMMEPAVGFVSEKLQAYLDEVESGR